MVGGPIASIGMICGGGKRWRGGFVIIVGTMVVVLLDAEGSAAGAGATDVGFCFCALAMESLACKDDGVLGTGGLLWAWKPPWWTYSIWVLRRSCLPNFWEQCGH